MQELNWKNFWENYRNIEFTEEADLFFQVGKTINKEPISLELFEIMLKDIHQNLALKKEDILLEFCCGNGLLTKPLSEFVSQVYASDFTEHLIQTAKKINQTEKIVYEVADAKENANRFFTFDKLPNKILMNDALSCFRPEDLIQILGNIESEKFKFYITGIPNDELKWNFYNTDERKSKYLELKEKNDNFFDGIGRWWKADEIQKIAKDLNLKCTVQNQNPQVSNFRMNALFER